MPLPATTSTLVASGSFTDINLMLTLATFVLFVLFALVLSRFGWKPLLHVIEEREKSIREDVEKAQKAGAEAQALLLQHQDLVREAARKRDETLKQALHEAESLKAEVVSRAREESDRLRQQAREQIQRETAQAVQDIKGQVVDLAVEAAARIVTSSLSPEAQRKLVSEFIDALPKAR